MKILNNSSELLVAVFIVLLNFTNSQRCLIPSSICGSWTSHALKNYPNYANLSTPQLIENLGYPVEVHDEILTKDGYLLTLFRIPHSKKSPGSGNKIPVLLMHGVLASSAQWVWQPPERALVFMLVDAGFDVWIGNSRGTSYSLGHAWLSHDDPEDGSYWEFSFHQMGIFDIPAIINYITKVSGQNSIYYIGHSLGTTQLFVALTEHPELNPKIRTMFSLATAAYMGNITNPAMRALAMLTADYKSVKSQENEGRGKFLPNILNSFAKPFLRLCSIAAINCLLCHTAFGAIFGMDICQTNFTMLPGVMAHFPETTSLRTNSHISQHDFNGRFGQYDFGAERNLKIYGSRVPPLYDWSKFNATVVIISGSNDNIATPLDARKTGAALGSNLKLFKTVKNPEWTHMDHVLGIDADIYVYNDIIWMMKGQVYG